MRGVFLFFALWAQTACLWSQTFIGDASLPPVERDGFYGVFITPEATVHLNTSFTNIRIYNNQGIEVPYLFREERPKSGRQEFREYKILEKIQRPGCCTSLILHNPGRNPVTSISLIIKNADVTKDAVLLGSDDQRNWFALKEQFAIYAGGNTSGASEIKVVDFPLSNYTYFSLQISDSTNAPLNILGAGYFESVTSTGKYTEVPLQQISKTDSVKQKKSYVHFQFDTLRIVDLLELSMKGPSYFLRKAFLYERKVRSVRKGGEEAYYDLIQEVELSSKHATTMEVPGIKVKDLLLVIENDDNPPLDIMYGKAYLLNRYLVAYLTKEMSYSVKIGEEGLHTPVYDLPYFKDSIPANPPILEIGSLRISEKNRATSISTIFTTKAFIWVAVVLVIVILGVMSVRLLKDVGASGGE